MYPPYAPSARSSSHARIPYGHGTTEVAAPKTNPEQDRSHIIHEKDTGECKILRIWAPGR